MSTSEHEQRAMETYRVGCAPDTSMGQEGVTEEDLQKIEGYIEGHGGRIIHPNWCREIRSVVAEVRRLRARLEKAEAKIAAGAEAYWRGRLEAT